MLALKIILGIILFIVLVFSIPIKLDADYSDEFTASVGYLFLKFKLFPMKEKKKKTVEKKKSTEKSTEIKEEKPKKEKQEKDNFLLVFYHNQGFDGVINLIKDVLNIVEDFAKSVFLKHIVVKNLYLSVKMTGDDPAELAEKCGKMSAFIYPAMGKISNKMNVKNCKIYISPDFIGEESSALFNIKLSVRPICLTNAAVVLAFKAFIQLVRVAISNNQAAKPKKKIIKKVKKL